MKKTFRNLCLATIVACVPLTADDYVKSLVGFEGGYGKLNVETSSTPIEKNRLNVGHGGIKIGAETKNVRLFLNANYIDGDNIDNAITYGVSLQYLFNVSKYMNFFLGANAGIADIRLEDLNRNAIKYRKGYYGADAGMNFHFTESFDFEAGVRHSKMQDKQTVAGFTYELRDHTTAYGSFIFKFNLDK